LYRRTMHAHTRMYTCPLYTNCMYFVQGIVFKIPNVDRCPLDLHKLFKVSHYFCMGPTQYSKAVVLVFWCTAFGRRPTINSLPARPFLLSPYQPIDSVCWLDFPLPSLPPLSVPSPRLCASTEDSRK